MKKPSVEDFAGYSEITALMRSQCVSAKEAADGLQTPLGAIETWPSSFRNAFAILLNSGCPMFLVWDCASTQNSSGERILFYNDAYLSLLKETQLLISFDRIKDSWTEDWRTVQADVEQVFTTGQALRREKKPFLIDRTGNGNGQLYTWSYSAVWDETGRIRGVFATGSQVLTDESVATATVGEGFQEKQALLPSHPTLQTQGVQSSLQQAEAALRESEARFQAFMSHSPASAWIADQDGRLLYLSPTYAQMFQFPLQDAVGKQIRDIYSEEFAQQFIENNRRVFQTGQVVETVETAPRPDGSLGSFLVYKFPIAQASGEVLLGGVAVDITERQQTEEALRQREEALRLVTNALPVLIAYVDKDHYYRFNNQTYETWFGRPAVSFTGQPVRAVLGDAAYDVIHPYIEQVLSGQQVSFESQIPYREGDTRYIRADFIPHLNSQGEVQGFFSLVSDISDRKKTEQDRERFLSVGSDLLVITGIDGSFQWVSPTFERTLGWTVVEMTSRPWTDFVHPDDVAVSVLETDRLFAGNETIAFENRYRHKDGSYRWFLWNARPYLEEQVIYGAAVDITERKQAEVILQAKSAELQHVTETVGVGLTRCGRDWRYLSANPAYAQLAGLDPEEIVGRSIVEVMGEAAMETIRPYIERVLRGERVEYEAEVPFAAGGLRCIHVVYTPDKDGKGNIIGWIASVIDITQRKQAEKALERYQLLSEHSRDIVLYFRSNGQILEANQAAVQAYGYDRATLLTLKLTDLRAHETLAVMPEQFEQASQQGILFETVHRRQDGSHFPVEVSAQSVVFSDGNMILSVIRDITERKRAETEREQLLVREQAAREVAEVAEQRARFLAEASTTLTSSLDYEYTLSSVAQAVVPTMADWCAVDILKDDGTLERLATTHIDPVKVQWGRELHRRYPPDLNAPRGVAQVLRTGQSEYYPTISDDQLVVAARDAEHLKLLREIGFSSAMLVPLNARGKTLGIISFVSTESGRAYSPDDLSLAEELARRSAIALDNARLYQEAQQARQEAERAADRTARLQTVTAALSESLTPEQVAEVIVEQSMATLEAVAALVVLVSLDRTELEIVKSVGYQTDLVESWRKFSIDTDVPLANAIRTGEPVWVETMLERIAHYPHLAEVYKRYEFNAWIALPLVVEGKAIGGMLLSFKEFRLLSQDDRDFVLALTRQCAQAIVRAQLYAAEQQARAAAEKANRIKDEFLAVLSHELRSPLNPILGWSKLLQQGKLDAARTAAALETIERNAKLQAQLIDDLLDISRILRGKLTLNTLPVSLSFVIAAAIDTVRLAIDAKAIQLKLAVDPEVGQVLGDAARLQQVVWNLLANAAKFTPSGGQITVSLTQVETYAQLQVKDTGKGIHPTFLPYVFEHFRQEDGATTRQFGGLGLGLAIVRQIVEMHGGSVQAESPGEGLGATFTVKLPLAKTGSNQAQTIRLDPPAVDLKGLRVLVVDDEADMRELAAFVLEQQGAAVITAASAQEALTALERFTPDVLLSDIGMPEMDGYMLMREVRSRAAADGGQIPAIALTAYAGEFNQQQALAAGFQQHLAKPIEPMILIDAIANLRHQSQQEECKP